MGERGPVPQGGTEGHRSKAEIEAQTVHQRAVVIDHPGPKPTWSLVTAEAWRLYWESYVASAVETVDLPSLVRLFDLVDRQERMWEKVDEEGYTQPTERSGDRPHPLIGAIAQLDGMIDRYERQFGIRPLSRARLGLKAMAAKSAAEKIGTAQGRRGRVVDKGEAPPPDDEAADPEP